MKVLLDNYPVRIPKFEMNYFLGKSLQKAVENSHENNICHLVKFLFKLEKIMKLRGANLITGLISRYGILQLDADDKFVEIVIKSFYREDAIDKFIYYVNNTYFRKLKKCIEKMKFSRNEDEYNSMMTPVLPILLPDSMDDHSQMLIIKNMMDFIPAVGGLDLLQRSICQNKRKCVRMLMAGGFCLPLSIRDNFNWVGDMQDYYEKQITYSKSDTCSRRKMLTVEKIKDFQEQGLLRDRTCDLTKLVFYDFVDFN